MVHQGLTHLKVLNGQEQAIYFHSRERRRSLAGVVELFRKLRIFGVTSMPVSPIDIAQFPDQDMLITFQTAIRITDAAPVGLIFELGNATTAVAAWVDGSELIFRAGDTTTDRALASFDNTIDLPDGLEVDLVFSVRPGDGRIRVWANGNEIARDTAANGQLPNGWAAASDGAFATAANGTLPADVTETGTPTNFEVIEPLSVYVGQVPRHFV